MVLITLDQMVALLGVVLTVAVYSLMGRLGVPPQIQVGAAVLSALVVAIFWSTVCLGADDEDDV